MPEESISKYLESSPRITINISIATKKDNLNNLPELVTQIEELSERLGI